jgi:hypothetical protein
MTVGLGLTELNHEAVSARATFEGDTVSVALVGNADMSAHAALRTYFGAVDAEVTRLGARELRVDVTQLYFMNSSCLSILSALINRISNRSAPSRYRIVFRFNRNLRWQERSIRALCNVAEDLVSSIT